MTTANGTAQAPDDYTSRVPIVLGFAAGQTTRLVAVSVQGDALVEPNETFRLDLSAPVGVLLGDTAAIATIANDDSANVPGRARSELGSQWISVPSGR